MSLLRTRRAIGVPVIALAAIALAGMVVASLAPAEVRAARHCDVPDMPLQPIELALVDEINIYRRSLGLTEVTTTAPSLRRAALWKSQHRAEGGAETHDDPDRRWDERLNDCGYTLDAPKGENLAAFEGDLPEALEPAAVVEAWRNSPTHDQVLRDPSYRVVGVARVRAPGTLRTYWTADFGGMPE